VLRRLDLTAADTAHLRRLLPRAALDVRAALESVTPLVEAVAARGYPAVREATMRFDGVDVAEPRVPAAALRAALAGLDPAVRDALAESIRRARIVHAAHPRTDLQMSGRWWPAPAATGANAPRTRTPRSQPATPSCSRCAADHCARRTNGSWAPSPRRPP